MYSQDIESVAQYVVIDFGAVTYNVQYNTVEEGKQTPNLVLYVEYMCTQYSILVLLHYFRLNLQLGQSIEQVLSPRGGIRVQFACGKPWSDRAARRSLHREGALQRRPRARVPTDSRRQRTRRSARSSGAARGDRTPRTARPQSRHRKRGPTRASVRRAISSSPSPAPTPIAIKCCIVFSSNYLLNLQYSTLLYNSTLL